jgi:hypothetical protein
MYSFYFSEDYTSYSSFTMPLIRMVVISKKVKHCRS